MKKTFIKMQSLSRKALLCGGLIAMAAALVGCSSDAPDPGSDPNPGVAQTDGDPLTVISDQATLSGLVLNYGSNAEAPEAPKAFTLPDVPKHDNAVNIKEATDFAPGDLNKYTATGIIIPAGWTYNCNDAGHQNLNVNTGNTPINIFIAGTLEGDITNTGACNVYILKGGSWRIIPQNGDPNHHSLSHIGMNIYDYNEDNGIIFPFEGNNVTCSFYGKVFNYADKKFHFTNNADICVEGAVNVDEFNLVESHLSAKCLTANKVFITNNANNYVGSYINVKELSLTEGARITLNENAYAKIGKLTSWKPDCGFSSPYGEATIYADEFHTEGHSLGGKLVLTMTGKFSGNIKAYFGEITTLLNGKKTLVTVDKLQKGSENVNFYPGEDFDEKKYGMTECPSGEGGGNGGNGGGDKPNPDPVKPDPNKPDPFKNNPEIFVEVVSGDDHTHQISATGVDVSGNKAYISWHERGGNIHGCIETIEINPAVEGGYKAEVTSWMETDAWEYNSGDPSGATASTAYDFNHIIYDHAANSLLTVGEHAKKGGIIGRIKLGEAFGKDAKLDIFENRQLGVEKWSGKENQGLVAGGSGNCVVISPDRTKLLVASRGGYLAIPYDSDPFVREDGKHIVTSKDIKSLVTDGSAKHLALYGDQLVSIEYIESSEKADWWEDTKTALPAKISLWNWKDFPEGTPTSVEVPAFSPVFGKDVIAMDANYIYSCQGHNGVAIYDKSSLKEVRFNVKDCYARNLGQCQNSLSKKESESAAANGLAVDEDYLYIAYGAAGLWVLDKKKNFEPVGFYNSAVSMYPGNDKEHPKASANYVKVMNEFGIKMIIVAYGRDGVKVFKLRKD